jgi:hypothetical protein
MLRYQAMGNPADFPRMFLILGDPHLPTRLHADAARDAAREAIIRLMLEPGPFVELATGDLDQRMQVSMQMEFRQAA